MVQYSNDRWDNLFTDEGEGNRMIDHVSIPVRNLPASTEFYESLLAEIGYRKLVAKEGTVGFGKKYPDFWLNERLSLDETGVSDGFHVCIRASSVEKVVSFHKRALELGAHSYGEPGIRPHYSTKYFAAFIIDKDGNRVEVVTFVD
jgi:catechol 2,3-dioxygenase-like lactoylglutathione lyase family enzyme